MEAVGANKDKFMSQLGIIARNGLKVPLTYKSWSEVPSKVLNSLWREVQENTNAPLEYCANCLKSIGKLWRNWKHLVKANHYLAHETDEERLSYVPPRVIDDQWKTLVKYWGSEQAKNITNRNKANRELQGLPHRTGRKGFSDVRFKMQQEGESTDRVSLWVKTRTPSFGAQHDPIATEGNFRARKRASGNKSKRDAIQTQSDFALEQLQPSTLQPSDPSCSALYSGGAGRSFSTNTRNGPSMRKDRKSTHNNASPGNGIQMQTHCALSQQQFSLSNSSDSSNAAPSSSETGVSSMNDERIRLNGILDDASVVNVIERQIQYGLEQHQPSTSAPSDPTNHAPNSIETGVRIKTRKGRGPAKGFDDWGSGEKLHVDFNEFMQPVGVNKDKFMSQLGMIARNGQKISLTYASWKKVPPEVLDSIWSEVQENSNAPVEYRASCLKAIGRLWRNWKHLVKTHHYLVHDSDEKRLSYVPPRVIDDQWKALVEYWGSEQAQNVTNRNKKNRELQAMPHRTGRKGFSEIRFQMEQEGESTDRVSVWMKTRTPKGGSQIDPKTKEVISKLNDRLSQVPELEQTPELREEIFIDVMGSDGHGRVRTFGAGPSRKEVNIQTSKAPMYEMLVKVRTEMQEQATMREKRMQEEFTAAQSQMQAQLDMMRSCLEKAGITMPSGGVQIPNASSVHETPTHSSG
ncbi:hypothetical protein Syun_020925 [Stephania yunnanensis]|uniref:Uncharacterized protein n=1 Tax=Stephania yunnanensis TaxID=152371 RepID=A0AAP0NPB4_9MAGN